MTFWTLATSLSDWSDAGALLGTVVAVAGIGLVVLQLRGAAATTRAQATIQFQQAFKESASARGRLLRAFPVHTDVLAALGGPGAGAQWATWTEWDDLEPDQRADAIAVINAMNDVAQYVADGLSLRSALQQYHTIFIRAGVLLNPYIDKRNAPGPSGSPARIGRRIPTLYNVALDYQRLNPKHVGRRVVLERAAIDGSGDTELDLCGGVREVSPHPGFPDEPRRGSRRSRRSLRSALRAGERELRS
jgi:hypothetical protein